MPMDEMQDLDSSAASLGRSIPDNMSLVMFLRVALQGRWLS